MRVLRYDTNSSRAIELLGRLKEHIALESLPQDLCLVIGGDGYMLRVISELGQGYTYLGINSGRLGFMLNRPNDLAETAELLKRGAWRTLSVPRLQMTATTEQGGKVTGLALNDAYLERASGQTAHLRVEVNGVEIVERIVCDGVIVSTALGSTAYSFSAGGPICHPTLRHIQVTAISAHSPRLPPIVLPSSATVEITALETEKRPVRVVTDGIDHPGVTGVSVRDGNSDIKLAFLEGHDTTASLIETMLKT